MKNSNLRDIAIKGDFYGAAALTLVFVCAFGIILTMADCGKYAAWLISIPFAAAAGLAVAVLRDRAKGKLPVWTLYLAAAAILAAVFAIFHSEIIEGAVMIVNRTFDAGEKSQSYVYERIRADASWDEAGSYAPYTIVWAGMTAGLFTAFAPARDRKWLIAALPLLLIVLAAFFGIQPSLVWMFIMIASAFIAVPRSSLKFCWPLLIIAAMIFFAAAFAGPGEISGISAAGDQIRDALAIQTAGYEGTSSQDTIEDQEEEEENEGGSGGLSEFFNGSDVPPEIRRLRIVIALIFLIALILFVPAAIHDRLEKKRRAVRGAIGSEDPTEAVRAMFPYTVRWLGAGGLALSNKSFAGYDADVRQLVSDRYADEYMNMYALWRQAAYGSMPVSEPERDSMKQFMEKTIAMVKEKNGLRGRFDVRFRRAL